MAEPKMRFTIPGEERFVATGKGIVLLDDGKGKKSATKKPAAKKAAPKKSAPKKCG